MLLTWIVFVPGASGTKVENSFVPSIVRNGAMPTRYAIAATPTLSVAVACRVTTAFDTRALGGGERIVRDGGVESGGSTRTWIETLVLVRPALSVALANRQGVPDGALLQTRVKGLFVATPSCRDPLKNSTCVTTPLLDAASAVKRILLPARNTSPSFGLPRSSVTADGAEPGIQQLVI